jgi:hypothetical protein
MSCSVDWVVFPHGCPSAVRRNSNAAVLDVSRFAAQGNDLRAR